MGVTKTVGVEEARALWEMGIHDLGENRVKEAGRKQDALADLGARWHMIGHLQTNKAPKVAAGFALIHSVDTVRLGEAISRAAQRGGVVARVLIQVNVSAEESKSGFEPAQLDEVLAELTVLKGIEVSGFMTMAPFVDDPEETRPVFARLRELRDRHQASVSTLHHLSMGMTRDFEVAIEEGADIIRVGSALFREE